MVTAEKINKAVLFWLGKEASPRDLAPDEYGCVETITNVLRYAGCEMPVLLSTRDLYNFLNKSKEWVGLRFGEQTKEGDLILSVTGQGGMNGVKNGHVGIILRDGNIASNDSSTGKFEQYYNLTTWKNRWATRGGYPTHFYRLKPPVEPETAPVSEISPEKAKIASDALKVAQEAIKEPSLWGPVSALLQAVVKFLGFDKRLGFGGIINLASKEGNTIMFQNYSQTYASQILVVAGFVTLLGKQFGWAWAEGDIAFTLGAIANFAGVVWALVHRYSQGDVTPLGGRKVRA
jgi:hypothetical protein